MQQGVTIFQRRIVIGAVLCALAFSLVVIRLVHVTLLQSYGAATGGAGSNPNWRSSIAVSCSGSPITPE